ncbi:putative flagellar hook-associated protein 2 [Octadecabacter antarcticus 307]|uniref:Flagellar hook-associated protein 2 n=1 Tax=Octadecabacter antarcticus 307 TaxID=391626 RepID=M9R8K6_9RHOB|nr:flagellar filament capping protein FliD [Octadecabacter antarcticus]AGI68552.1 putative flagellar hook-associated protein 2 [Octadecabacter antarcticus 307]
MDEIRPDVLSTLSRGGSGLQLRSLTSSLVAAETSGERSLNERNVSNINTTISAMGQLSGKIGEFGEAMASVVDTISRTASSSITDAISIEVTDGSLAANFSSRMEVRSLASEQVLSFLFDSTVTTSTTLNQGTVSLNTPAWNNTQSFKLDDSNNTLIGMVEALNSLGGVTASLFDTGTGYALIIKSEDGLDNALDSDSIDAIKSALSMTSSAIDDETDSTHNPLGVSSSVTAAQNADILVDGVSVVRSSNEFEDLFLGHKITLNAVGTSMLSSSETNDSAQNRVIDFISVINDLKSYLNEATQRGINGADPGPLAGDSAAQSVLAHIRNIATRPIVGFGEDPVYLAEIGVRTERDGTLILDENVFERALEENSAIVDAFFSTQFSSDNANLKITGLSFAQPTAGSYVLIYNASAETATLDGEPLTIGSDSNGNVLLTSTTVGNTYGIQITLDADENLTTTVRYGQSLAAHLQDYSDSLLGRDGMLARRETNLGNQLLDFETRLEDVDAKAAALTERYNIQFGRMEAVIASLNQTGEYMQSLMDAWNAD